MERRGVAIKASNRAADTDDIAPTFSDGNRRFHPAFRMTSGAIRFVAFLVLAIGMLSLLDHSSVPQYHTDGIHFRDASTVRDALRSRRNSNSNPENIKQANPADVVVPVNRTAVSKAPVVPVKNGMPGRISKDTLINKLTESIETHRATVKAKRVQARVEFYSLHPLAAYLHILFMLGIASSRCQGMAFSYGSCREASRDYSVHAIATVRSPHRAVAGGNEARVPGGDDGERRAAAFILHQ